MKTIISNKKNITRYGGIIPIIIEMKKRKLPELIDSFFENDMPRVKQCKYKFSDIFITWIVTALCGAKRIDNVTGLREKLECIPGLNIPSHDTMGRLMKKMATAIVNKDRVSPDVVNTNYYDDNVRLNKLLIQASILMGALKEGQEYILDVDCTFISTRCAGAKSMKDKDQYGFYPMICMIGELPVYISMRNGNSSADFRIKECVSDCIDLLEESNITVKKVRTDGAGYRTTLLDMLHNRGIEFNCASQVNINFKRMWRSLDKAIWRDVTIETANSFKQCKITEIDYFMHGSIIDYRVIALQVPIDKKIKILEDDDEKQMRERIEIKMNNIKNKGLLKSPNKRYVEGVWNEIRGYRYKMIITNDFKTSAEEIVLEYNKRGDAEKKFAFMKGDFGWKWPPFMWMNENTVFMISSALANNVFRSIAILFNEHIPNLKLNARREKFQKRFINIMCEIFEDCLKFEITDIDFSKIC